MLRGYLQALVKSQTPEPLSEQLRRTRSAVAASTCVDHLAVLRQSLR